MADAPSDAGDKGTVRVGYALREKRIRSFMLPELVAYGKEKGVTFVKIDPDVSLEAQGPFDLVLHKLDAVEWANNLTEYSRNHPEVVIVDEYDNVHKLDDRRQMLEAVEKLDEQALGAKVLVPRQLIIEADVQPSAIAAFLEKESFPVPAVAKPLEANGSHSSHSLSLVLNKNALQHLEPPVLLQEFVNHGGVLFKLYILGDAVMVFRRHSLPDIDDPRVAEAQAQEVVDQLEKKRAESIPGFAPDQVPEEVAKEKSGLVELSRISNVHLSAEELQDNRVTDPSPELMRALGMSLKQLLGLHAFNVDILRENGHGERYYIVDINYMPGYERIPEFPSLFVGFVLSRVHARREALAGESTLGREGLMQMELSVPVSTPQAPYPVLQGKKKWIYFRAAMKLCGLEHRSRKKDSDE